MIILRLLRNPLFLIGFLIIFSMLAGSLIHKYVYNDEIKQVFWLLDEKGDLLDAAPISPSKDLWFGTDRQGYDMFMKLVSGAKYTLSVAFLIAFLRVSLSLIVGVIYGTYFIKFKRYVDGFVDSFHYIPLTLIAYYILFPILWETPLGFTYTFSERVFLEILILTLLAVPVTSVLIGNEVNQILKKEFILGGSTWQILSKHVRPHLLARLAIIFGQQVIQVLLVLAHLGLFLLFFGGSEVCYGIMCDPATSFTNEWSGLLGSSKNWYRTDSDWIFFGPIYFFAIAILGMNFMLEGFKRVMNDRGYLVKKKKKRKLGKSAEVNLTKDLFEMK
jgi:peptide/nickel transport system permease protein